MPASSPDGKSKEDRPAPSSGCRMVAAFDAKDAVAEGDDTWAAGRNLKGDSVAKKCRAAALRERHLDASTLWLLLLGGKSDGVAVRR